MMENLRIKQGRENWKDIGVPRKKDILNCVGGGEKDEILG
jgi:hypothetical protein